MAKGATFKVVEHWAKNIARTLDEIDNTTLKVGVTEKSGRAEHENGGDGVTVGDVAFYNEHGTVTIPARSFIRDWVDGNIDKIAKEQGEDVMRVITTNEKMKTALAKRGKKYRESVIRRILRGIPPPNSPVTIALKGGSIPLIDTGQLVEAIVYEVGKKQ